MNIDEFVCQPLTVSVSVPQYPAVVVVKNLFRIVGMQPGLTGGIDPGNGQSIAGLGDVRIVLPVIEGQFQRLVFGGNALNLVKDGDLPRGECLAVIHTHFLAVNGIILRRIAVER